MADMDKLSPYRSTEVVRVEQCQSCLHAERARRRRRGYMKGVFRALMPAGLVAPWLFELARLSHEGAVICGLLILFGTVPWFINSMEWAEREMARRGIWHDD